MQNHFPSEVIIDDNPLFIEDGVYVCYHNWSPYAKMVIQFLIRDKEKNIHVFDVDKHSVEWQEENLGDISHGWGEIIKVKNGIKSRLTNIFKD